MCFSASVDVTAVAEAYSSASIGYNGYAGNTECMYLETAVLFLKLALAA
jgi:hypothetical protein